MNESQVKNKLYVGNLPRGMTQHQVEEELKKHVVGESSISMQSIILHQSASTDCAS